MEISPAAGKILGMLMAYAVSSLGLLLAYYNYRKRILKAETIFTPVARAVIIGVVSVAVIGAVLTAAMATSQSDGPARDKPAGDHPAEVVGAPDPVVIEDMADDRISPAMEQGQQPGIGIEADHLLGLALPALIVLVSVLLTWLLYRHFSRQMSESVPPE
jgi:disulfide bond formation protein DsbB